MNTDEKNTLFTTVAAWPNWAEKIDVFLRSARKQGIDVEILDKGETWQGYYHHKIVRFREWLSDLRTRRPEIEYVVFTDSRDVVYIKPKHEILSQLRQADDEKILFGVDEKFKTWPMSTRWLTKRIAERFGDDGIVNSGCFAGRVDRLLALLSEAVRLHTDLIYGTYSPSSVESMLASELKPEYLSSDQFHFQALQAIESDLIAADTQRILVAGFKGGFPLLKTAPQRGSNGVMPLGIAGILHSPWVLPRKFQTASALARWRNWAEEEGIID